jgi:hypothetical protein
MFKSVVFWSESCNLFAASRTLFKASAGISWNALLIWPLAAFLVALAFDLAQYAYQSILFRIYSRNCELKIAKAKKAGRAVPEEFEYSIYWNYFPEECLWGKAGAAVAGYALLLWYIFGQLTRSATS